MHVVSDGLDAAKLIPLRAARPDLVLLAGGLDGGERNCVLASARTLLEAGAEHPVLVAGNAEASPEAVEMLRAGGVAASAAANVMPAPGRMEIDSARRGLRSSSSNT